MGRLRLEALTSTPTRLHQSEPCCFLNLFYVSEFYTEFSLGQGKESASKENLKASDLICSSCTWASVTSQVTIIHHDISKTLSTMPSHNEDVNCNPHLQKTRCQELCQGYTWVNSPNPYKSSQEGIIIILTLQIRTLRQRG